MAIISSSLRASTWLKPPKESSAGEIFPISMPSKPSKHHLLAKTLEFLSRVLSIAQQADWWTHNRTRKIFTCNSKNLVCKPLWSWPSRYQGTSKPTDTSRKKDKAESCQRWELKLESCHMATSRLKTMCLKGWGRQDQTPESAEGILWFSSLP